MRVERPVVRYHGGKWRLAPWIISNMPTHRIYVEPFGGGASVLLRKARTPIEVYNDADGDMVNLMMVVRDHGLELKRRIELTPYARQEYETLYEESKDPIERARMLIARSILGFGTRSAHRNTGFRSVSFSGSVTGEWVSYPKKLAAIIDRLRGVVIECKDAIPLMESHDSPETLHYVDPPYVHATRAKGMVGNYNYEMTEQEHIKLIAFLRTLKGKVLLSGYDHPIYNDGLLDWHIVKKSTFAECARPRVETLWLNPHAVERGLFANG